LRKNISPIWLIVVTFALSIVMAAIGWMWLVNKTEIIDERD
jgi:cell division septal protein FtsQ